MRPFTGAGGNASMKSRSRTPAHCVIWLHPSMHLNSVTRSTRGNLRNSSASGASPGVPMFSELADAPASAVPILRLPLIACAIASNLAAISTCGSPFTCRRLCGKILARRRAFAPKAHPNFEPHQHAHSSSRASHPSPTHRCTRTPTPSHPANRSATLHIAHTCYLQRASSPAPASVPCRSRHSFAAVPRGSADTSATIHAHEILR